MSSTRKLTEIPSCMRMSFNYPWESSPEKEIVSDSVFPLSDSDFSYCRVILFRTILQTLRPTSRPSMAKALQRSSSRQPRPGAAMFSLFFKMIRRTRVLSLACLDVNSLPSRHQRRRAPPFRRLAMQAWVPPVLFPPAPGVD